MDARHRQFISQHLGLRTGQGAGVPSRENMKVILKKAHLLLTLMAGIFLLSLSLSASLLVFGKELQHSIAPHTWTVDPERTDQSLTLPELVASLQRQAQSKQTRLKRLDLETASHLTWSATLTNGEQWNIDPRGGEVMSQFQRGEDLYSLALHFHRWLLAGESVRPWVRNLLSIAAAILILQVIIGLLLWLKPRKRALKRLRFKPGLAARPTITQLHLISGVFSSLLLILIAYSGIGFNWPVVGTVVEWFSASEIELPLPPTPVSLGGLQQLSLSISEGLRAMPDGELHRIYFPLEKGEPLKLRFKQPAEFHPFSYVWLDGGSGEVLGVYDASQATAATRVWNFKYKFHTGDFFGLPVRILWLLLSLLPSFFVISGLWLYFSRRKNLQPN